MNGNSLPNTVLAENANKGNYIMNDLKIWKLWNEAYLPEYGSEWAACFDLKASLVPSDQIKVYTKENIKFNVTVPSERVVTLHPKERMLIPTGLVFDLDEWQSIRIHPRSGLSLKQGIIVANCTGIVDADYVQQTYVMLMNTSSVDFQVEDGMRIAQAEVVPVVTSRFVLCDKEPTAKTSRNGGFGSTGT
jgi:dUTP pyrophosphatase